MRQSSRTVTLQENTKPKIYSRTELNETIETQIGTQKLKNISYTPK